MTVTALKRGWLCHTTPQVEKADLLKCCHAGPKVLPFCYLDQKKIGATSLCCHTLAVHPNPRLVAILVVIKKFVRLLQK